MKKPRFFFIALIVILPLLLLAAGSPAFGQTITLISPNTNGLVWSGANDITWSTSTSGWGPTDTVKIELSADSGVTYDTQLATNLPYDLEEFRFYTGATSSLSNYRIKVSWTADSTVFDESGYDFTISNSAPTGTSFFVNDTDTSNDVYCSAPGDNANNGLTPATPKWNLQSIIDEKVLGPGDVVYVDTGSWSLPHEIYITSADKGSADAQLAFAGSPNGTVFSGVNLAAAQPCLHVTTGSYLDLAHFTAQSSPCHGLYIASCSNTVLYDVRAVGNQ